MVNHPDDCQSCAFVPSPNSAPGPRSRKAQTAPNPCGSCGPPGVQTSVSIKPGMKLKESKTLPGEYATNKGFQNGQIQDYIHFQGHSRMRLHNAPQSYLWEQKALMLRGPDEGVTMICSSSRTWRNHGGHKNHTNIVYKAQAKSMDSRILTH